MCVCLPSREQFLLLVAERLWLLPAPHQTTAIEARPSVYTPVINKINYSF